MPSSPPLNLTGPPPGPPAFGLRIDLSTPSHYPPLKRIRVAVDTVRRSLRAYHGPQAGTRVRIRRETAVDPWMVLVTAEPR